MVNYCIHILQQPSPLIIRVPTTESWNAGTLELPFLQIWYQRLRMTLLVHAPQQIRDCIEPAPTAESFQIEGSQPHTSNLICLSSALGKNELSTNANPKSDMSQSTTPRQTPSRRKSARNGRHTNKPKPRATPKKNIISTVPKKANPPTSSESPRLFAPARRHGIRQPSGSKSKPAVSKQPSVWCRHGYQEDE